MKTLRTFSLALLLSLMAQAAAAFTLNVKIDEPARISQVATFPAQSGNVDFSTGECQLAFPDDDYAYSRTVYIAPKSGKYITSWTVADEDGNEVSSKMENKKTRIAIPIPPTADYGTLYVCTSDEMATDSRLTVNLTGNPAKVQFSFNATRIIDLHEGLNDVPFSSQTEATAYIMPQGVGKLYKVIVNGQENEGRITMAEGEMLMTYYLYPQDGDVVDIVTDFPDVDCNVAILLPDGADQLVAEVSLDGAPLKDWHRLETVKAGQSLKVTTNKDAEITSFQVNGKEMVYHDPLSDRLYWAHEWEGVITEDLEIKIEGAMIERNLTAKTHTFGWDDVVNMSDFTGAGSPLGIYSLTRFDGKALTIPAGDGEINFAPIDNPFRLVLMPYDDTATVDITVLLNGQPQNLVWGVLDLELSDGDELSLYFGQSPDAIRHQNAPTQNPDPNCYNLQGAKLPSHPTQPGIYILGGKKTIIK